MSDEKIIYCQVVVGAPGAGKTSYCKAMQNFLEQLGRESLIINLDPANEGLAQNAAFSMTELITVDEVMLGMNLGPNGALLYCMEWLEQHCDLLYSKIMNCLSSSPDCRYLLLDFPGQIELYTNINAVQSILSTMNTQWSFRLVVVHLTDSVLCHDPSQYISSLMTSLGVMLHLGLPHVNVLTKCDLIDNNTHSLLLSAEQYDGQEYLEHLAYAIDQEYQCNDSNIISRIINGDMDDNNNKNDNNNNNNDDDEKYKDDTFSHMKPDLSDDDDDSDYDNDCDDTTTIEMRLQSMSSDQRHKYHTKQRIRRIKRSAHSFSVLNHSIVDLLTDYSMVSLHRLSINDKYMMNDILQYIDDANGYHFRQMDINNMKMKSVEDAIHARTTASKFDLAQNKRPSRPPQ